MFGKKYKTCAQSGCAAVIDPKVAVSAWRTEIDSEVELYARKIYFCALHNPAYTRRSHHHFEYDYMREFRVSEYGSIYDRATYNEMKALVDEAAWEFLPAQGTSAQ